MFADGLVPPSTSETGSSSSHMAYSAEMFPGEPSELGEAHFSFLADIAMDAAEPCEPEVIEVPVPIPPIPPESLDRVLCVREVRRLLGAVEWAAVPTFLGRRFFDWGCFQYLSPDSVDHGLQELAASALVPLRHKLHFLSHHFLRMEYDAKSRALSDASYKLTRASPEVTHLLDLQSDTWMRISELECQFDNGYARRIDKEYLSRLEVDIQRYKQELDVTDERLRDAAEHLSLAWEEANEAFRQVRRVAVDGAAYRIDATALVTTIDTKLKNYHAQLASGYLERKRIEARYRPRTGLGSAEFYHPHHQPSIA